MENILLTIILLGAIQGLFLYVAIGRIPEHRPSNRWLRIFVLLISLTMLGRLLVSSGLISQFPNFLLLPDAIIFVYGPILYLYLQKLLIEKDQFSRAVAWHFFPALIYVLSEAPLLLDSQHPFHLFVAEHRYLHGVIVEGAALLHNLIYLALDYRLFRRYRLETHRYFSYPEHAPFLKTILQLIAVCLIAWSYSYLARILGSYNVVTALGYFIVWLVLPFTVYVLGYFAIRQPALFRMPPLSKQDKHVKTENNAALADIRFQLERIMVEEKPYLNPRLSLFELATMLSVTPHLLSRAINQGYGVNFSTFVNRYRVGEFQRLAQLEAYRDYTVLAIALEAGFNSKTTFNTAFKDITEKTPKEFLQELSSNTAA